MYTQFEGGKMYTYNKCGYVNSKFDWCPKCNKILKCVHSVIEVGRLKDLKIEFKNGVRNIILNYKICKICGKILESNIED